MCACVCFQKVQQESVAGDSDLMHEARQLRELHRYEFWVSAVTAVGEGPSSARVSQSPTSRGNLSFPRCDLTFPVVLLMHH
ncbi:hypothetical protein PR048_033104 [Dryococelus australis]|uniref:Uncharacterized protein n=1 Tax=Dryococelus australis TaxID=614101 RepID=A0ABQ9FZB0_9NEOP|nr:hypothetical protein PR048_033104 [Dryococelus australis]